MRIASDTAVMVSRFYNKVITLAEKVKHNEGNAQNKKNQSWQTLRVSLYSHSCCIWYSCYIWDIGNIKHQRTLYNEKRICLSIKN